MKAEVVGPDGERQVDHDIASWRIDHGQLPCLEICNQHRLAVAAIAHDADLSLELCRFLPLTGFEVNERHRSSLAVSRRCHSDPAIVLEMSTQIETGGLVWQSGLRSHPERVQRHSQQSLPGRT